eukprot:scaffold224452_cov18-Tisochrysis_lutea.AAC.2
MQQLNASSWPIALGSKQAGNYPSCSLQHTSGPQPYALLGVAPALRGAGLPHQQAARCSAAGAPCS